MKLQTYDELLHSKYRLTVMLFLFLNTATSLFFLLNHHHQSPSRILLPTLLIPTMSTMLLGWMFLKPQAKFPLLNSVALITGILWPGILH